MAIRNVIILSIPTLRAEFIVELISVLSDQGRHLRGLGAIPPDPQRKKKKRKKERKKEKREKKKKREKERREL